MVDLVKGSPLLKGVGIPGLEVGIQPGDTILYCGMDRAIVGLNDVLSPAIEAPRPAEYPTNMWVDVGLGVETIFHVSPTAVTHAEVFSVWDAMREEGDEYRYGPFHFGTQGMLMPIDSAYVARFFEHFGDRFSSFAVFAGTTARFGGTARGNPNAPLAHLYSDLPIPRAPVPSTMIAVAARRPIKFEEARLVNDYIEWSGRPLMKRRYPIRSTGEILCCDAFDKSANELIEAKSSSTRDDIRMALGQLLDYRRHHEAPPRLAVLLPEIPNPDLVALLRAFGVSVIYRQGSGFDRVDSVQKEQS
jgi:hypothetical protein